MAKWRSAGGHERGDELFPGTADAAFHCLNADTLVFGDVRVGKFSEFAEHDRHPEIFRKLSKSGTDSVDVGDAVCSQRGGVMQLDEIVRCSRIWGTPSNCCQSGVRGDPVQPRAESGISTEAVQILPGRGDGVLESILRVVMAPGDLQAYSPRVGAMSADQFAEGATIAFAAQLHKRSVVHRSPRLVSGQNICHRLPRHDTADHLSFL